MYHVSQLSAVGTVVNTIGSDRFDGEQITALHGGMVGLPRHAFKYKRAGEQAVVGAPGCSLWSNKNQVFERAPIDPRGEVTDWLWVRPEITVQAAARHNPAVIDRPDDPFPFAYGYTSSRTQLELRLIIAAAKSGIEDQLAIDEAIVSLFARMVDQAFAGRSHKKPRKEATQKTHRNLVNEAIRLLTTDPTKKWTLDELGSKVHTAPLHFCRVFKQITGYSIRDYQLQIRLALAMDLLECGGVSVSDAARMAGFSSQSHLSDAFYEITQLRPSRASAYLSGKAATSLRSLMDNQHTDHA